MDLDSAKMADEVMFRRWLGKTEESDTGVRAKGCQQGFTLLTLHLAPQLCYRTSGEPT